MPADSLQLYHPMTLQSMPNTPHSHHHHHSEYPSSSRHLLNLPTARSHHQVGGGNHLDYAQNRNLGLYAPGQGPHSAGHSHSSHPSHYSSLPLSAPPTLPPNNPFTSSNPQPQQQMYNNYPPSPRVPSAAPVEQSQPQYYSDGHSHSGSAPGSGYGTPQ